MTKAKEESRSIRLQLICMLPLEEVGEQQANPYGLQDRQQKLHAGQPNFDGSITYTVAVPVARISETNQIRFRGDYVHGTPKVAFLYLSLKQADSDPPIWIKRLKIPLPTLSWDTLIPPTEENTFFARISGEGSGTVPLLGKGWVKQNLNFQEASN